MDAHQERMEASMNAWQKETLACQEATEACQEKAKTGQEEVEAVVDVFEERFYQMDTTDLEANQENLDTVVEHQEVPKEEAAVKTLGALEN
jgi:hypothetical protein